MRILLVILKHRNYFFIGINTRYIDNLSLVPYKVLLFLVFKVSFVVSTNVLISVLYTEEIYLIREDLLNYTSHYLYFIY
jgi:hypothetical protein